MEAASFAMGKGELLSYLSGDTSQPQETVTPEMPPPEIEPPVTDPEVSKPVEKTQDKQSGQIIRNQ